MDWIIWVVLGLLLCIIVIFGLLMASTIRKKTFGARCEGNPNLKYFTHLDFPGLIKDPISFHAVDGVVLHGGIFRCAPIADCVGLVVFVHGMGGGHTSYMTEINHFARQGYAVLGYDNTGTMESEGTSLVGMHRAAQDLDAALSYCESRDELSDCKKIVVGHSWGGFAAGTVFCLPHSVQGVVSFSGFNSYPQVVVDLAKRQMGRNMGYLKPFIWLDEVFAFGSLGRVTVQKSAQRRTAPMLGIHGALDEDVDTQNSVAKVLNAIGSDQPPAVQGIILPQRYHNPYSTIKAETALRQMVTDRAGLHKTHGKVLPPDVQSQFYDGLDFAAMTEQDTSVMEIVDTFMGNCIKG